MEISISALGAVADGVTCNTAIIQRAIDGCTESGGGRVIVSGGVYCTGTLVLKENVELHLASDGVLLGSPRCEDYPEREDVRHVDSARLPRFRNACLIYAEECKNISITGNGTIDCNGKCFVRKKEKDLVGNGWSFERIDAPTPPRAVFLAGCRNVRIEDVTMVNQPAGWSYWITDCDFVTVDKIKILADVRYPNNDGIHINCSRNVTVSNCQIVCGDDCIVVRANSVALPENKVCERVVVTNCTLTSYASGIRIGWINDGVIRNCTFSNIVMTDTTIGINIYLPYKAPNTADKGREATWIENLSFQGIVMNRTASRPIQIYVDPDPYVQCRAVRNLYFSGIHASGPIMPKIQGRKENPVEGITFSDCSFEMTDGRELFDATQSDIPPRYNGGFYPMEMHHVKNVSFHSTRFDAKQ